MDTECNSKTLRGSLTIIFCVFTQIEYHMSFAMKSGILRQLNSRTHDALQACCPVKMQRLTQIIQTDSAFSAN